MFERLLVPLDGTPSSERAMTTSIALARKLQAAIVGFVAEPDLRSATEGRALSARVTADAQAVAQAHAQEVLGRLKAQAAEAQVAFEGVTTPTIDIDEAIIRCAQAQRCDLIVMVTHGRGTFGERLFGSHTKSVMSKCALPLLVLR
ncbi:MAG: universal stress protein [Ideonella sp.]|nr:universal stress protein [Ideonella sp.]